MPELSIIIDWFSPAYKAGGPIISVQNIVDHLNDKFNIKIVCSNLDHDKTILNETQNRWVNRKGFQVFYADNNFNSIKKVIDKSDVLFINGIYSFQYNFLPALELKGRKIISVRGMLDPGGLSQKRLKKFLYLQIWKILGLHRKCEYHASTETEKKYIQSVLGTHTKIWVIPNLPRLISYKTPLPKKRNAIILCTVALIGTMKNHLLVLQSLQDCKAEVEYHIYGPVKEQNYWKLCLAVIASLPANIRVHYHRHITPALVTDAIAKCHVYIQPSKSENFGHSLYDALSSGRPVITSHFTPWNKLEYAQAGKNVSINSAAEITAAIDFFAAMDSDQLEVWSTQARNFALMALDIEEIKTRYIKMFNGIEE